MRKKSYVLAYPGKPERLWLTQSGYDAGWLSVTRKPRNAAEFPNLEAATKALAEHHKRVGVLTWKIAVRV